MKLELSKEKLKYNQFLFCLFCLIFLTYREQSLLILLSVFRVGFDAQFHRLCYKTIGSYFSVYYRVMEHLGHLHSSTSEHSIYFRTKRGCLAKNVRYTWVGNHYVKVKNDHRSTFSNLSNWREDA